MEQMNEIYTSWINGQKDQAYNQYLESGMDALELRELLKQVCNQANRVNLLAYFLYKSEQGSK